MLGKATEKNKTSFGQLVIYADEQKNNFDVSMAALFSYRSLLLFKLIKETPLNFSDARIIMQYLQSSFTIAGIHHPEKGGATKFIKMKKESNSFTDDILTGEYILTAAEEKQNKEREEKMKWALDRLGCIPLKTIHTPHGGSIHYAGTLPFSESGNKFSLHPNGKLAGTKNVFVADGSGFNYLPAKGLTLTLMANAVLKNE
jgi:choline dehydrogenase-like flavoprotein